MRRGGSNSELIKAVYVVGICLLVAGVAGTGLLSISERKMPTLAPRGDSIKAFSLSHSTHVPISINGNSQFTSANGVVSGAGTASDPYVIQGWSIETSAQSDISEIDIENSSAHFIIKDCHLYANGSSGASSLNFGISLGKCTNGLVDNNSCSHIGGAGILLAQSDGCIVSNNNCSLGYGAGIWVASSNITVRNNSCSQNFAGITLVGSSICSLINNNCSNNFGWGMESVDSSKNSLFQNVFSGNGQNGILISSGSHNLIWNNSFISNGAEDDGRDNSWNSPNGYGNYWSNWTSPDKVVPFGRVDLPYNITGSARAKDYYPLTAPHISDPPYTPAHGNALVPILVIAAVVIVAVILMVLIFIRRRRVRIAEPPASSQ